DSLHILVAQQDAKSVLDLLGIRASPNIEEIRWHASRILDDVHSGHCQSSAINHAGDIAVELDVIEGILRSLDLQRIFLADVAQLLDVLVPEKRVVIKIHLGVERE